MSFEREDRYIVVKRKDLLVKSPWLASALDESIVDLDLPKRKYLVVESDWPEYEVVWKMIEDRVNATK